MPAVTISSNKVAVRMWIPCRLRNSGNKSEGVVKQFDTHGTSLKTRGILGPMPSVKSEAQGARRQLERVLGSPGFARNERLSAFLRFTVERHMEGRDREIKESVIAVEVFGRRPDFDPRQDPVVRTEAARLRARLAEYYANEGKADAVIIEMPKGGYV